MSFFKRWYTFLHERHEPFGTSLMILAFCAANAAFAWPEKAAMIPGWGKLVAGYLLIWGVFLHMRLFDEVKDYEFDCEHNPERPLARKLISLQEFGVITLLVILGEAALAANIGWPVFTTFAIVLAFTLLMRMEFFVVDWLRPKLEAYAISHTFSAGLMGVLIYSSISGRYIVDAPAHVLEIAFGNWFVFNVFEFGRKTFGREEERDGVDSYSARLYPWGAVVLLVINMALGYLMLFWACQGKFGGNPVQVLAPAGIIAALVLIAGIVYAAKPTGKNAKLYRGVVTFYLLAYHVAVAAGSYLLLSAA